MRFSDRFLKPGTCL